MEHKYYIFTKDASQEQLEPFLKDISEDWSIAHIANFTDTIHYLIRREGSWPDRQRRETEKNLEASELERRKLESVEKIAGAIDHQEPWED